MSFAKIEAPLLGFWVFSPKPPPPHAPLDHTDPGPKPRLHPTPSRSPLSKNELSPTMCSLKLSPGSSDFGFCHHPARCSIAHPTTSNTLYPTPSWSTSSKNEPPAMHSPKLSPSGSVSFLFVLFCFFWFFGKIFFVLHILLIVALVEQYCGHLLYDFISMIISFLCFSLT